MSGIIAARMKLADEQKQVTKIDTRVTELVWPGSHKERKQSISRETGGCTDFCQDGIFCSKCGMPF